MGGGRVTEVLANQRFLNPLQMRNKCPWLTEKDPKHRMPPATHRQRQAQKTATQVELCCGITRYWHKQTRVLVV